MGNGYFKICVSAGWKYRTFLLSPRILSMGDNIEILYFHPVIEYTIPVLMRAYLRMDFQSKLLHDYQIRTSDLGKVKYYISDVTQHPV